MTKTDYYIGIVENGQAYLAHYGTPGMKRGVRRYTNPDGSLTEEGFLRYYGHARGARSFKGDLNRVAAKVYGLNAKTYSKLGNKVLASMNRSAQNRMLKKAQEADAAKAARPVRSFKGRINRTMANIYDINARTYDKLGNSLMAGMNRAAKDDALRAADEADAAKAVARSIVTNYKNIKLKNIR